MNHGLMSSNSSRKTVMWHCIGWLVLYLIFTFVLSFYGNIRDYLLINIVTVSQFIVAYYLLRYIQIPLLYDQGKVLYFVLSLIVSSLFLYILYWTQRRLWLEVQVSLFPSNPFDRPVEFLLRVVRFYSPAMLLLAVEFNYRHKQELIRLEELEKERIFTELKFLKAQINPHFLFNTLNNLYSFVITGSPKAPDMVARLSGILDYILNKSKNEFVALREESKTIEDYLQLEKIRYGDRLTVEYEVVGIGDVAISPLILLSIVENAFKHGASGDIDAPKIKISLSGSTDEIKFNVWNTKSSYRGVLNDAYKSGIGLSNIIRQLKLIYPQNHVLIIDDPKDSFNVSLTINPYL